MKKTRKPLSDEHKKKLSIAHMGIAPWNKGLKGTVGGFKGKTHSIETRKKISDLHKGRMPWNKGKSGLFKHSEETKKKMSVSQKGHPGYLKPKNKLRRVIGNRGYVRLYRGRQYSFEHRDVVSKHIGRDLLKTERVHHINGIKTDNRIENLRLCKSNSDHAKIRHYEPPILKICRECEYGYEKETCDIEHCMLRVIGLYSSLAIPERSIAC